MDDPSRRGNGICREMKPGEPSPNRGEPPDVSVRPMIAPDLPSVARLHAKAFPRSRSTSIGQPFIRRMYRWFCSVPDGIAYVAERDGRVIGFAAGSSGDGYGRRVFRYAVPQILWGLATRPQRLVQPRTWFLWRSYLRGLRRPRTSINDAAPHVDPDPSAGLASIAVSFEGRGQGISDMLLQAFEAAARSHGCVAATLSVEPENAAARRLYERHGWRQDDEGPGSVHFRKDLTPR